MKRFVFLAALVAPSVAAAQPNGYYNGPPQGAWDDHNGLTFEGNLGLGGMWCRGCGANQDDNTDPSVGANVGIGGFINPQLAITLRIASVNYTEEYPDNLGGTVTFSAIFVGPSVQYWVNPNFWIGGGIGYGLQHAQYQNDFGDVVDSQDDPTGVALDLRAGYTFYKSMRNSLNISAEYTPGYYKAGNQDYQVNGFAILFGYQYL